jgi:hypothetical protein
MHLSYWFKQLLDQAMLLGMVSNYRCSSSRDEMDFPAGGGILERKKNAPLLLISHIKLQQEMTFQNVHAGIFETFLNDSSGSSAVNLLVDGVGSSAWQVTMLPPPFCPP